MNKRTTTVHIKSALPVYGAALIFLLCALILPIYKLWAILVAGGLCAGGGFALTKLFPGRTLTTEEEILTGNKQLDAQILESRAILARFRAAAEAAGDERVKRNINRIADAAEGVVDEVIKDEGDRDDAYTFFIYYLPTLDKLLAHYDYFALRDKSENASLSRERIEGCLDMVADAFENFLNKLYKNDAISIKANVEVLKTMLRTDGLAGKTASAPVNPADDIESITRQLRAEAAAGQVAAPASHD